MQKILIVDDEFRMRKLIKDFLTREQYEVLEAENGYEALTIFKENSDISLIILDIMMPVMDGWSTCSELRKISNVHVIMLTAKATEEDQLKGYELGIDEYVTKPVSPKLLVAKVNAILSRYEETKKSIFPIVVDENKRMVFVNSKKVELSFKEFEMLAYFLKHKNVAISRERLLKDIWGYEDEYYGDTRIIDTHIKKMRQKLGDAGEYIQTVRGYGYKLEV
jgi:DNA-binding response OmpR family regulator